MGKAKSSNFRVFGKRPLIPSLPVRKLEWMEINIEAFSLVDGSCA